MKFNPEKHIFFIIKCNDVFYDTVISKVDFDRVNAEKWYKRLRRDDLVYFYRVTKNKDGKRSTQDLHRFIAGVNDKFVFIDHKNGDTLVNARENLRKASPAENARNRCAKATNKLGVKGLTLMKNGRYRVRIMIDGKAISLGTSKTIREGKDIYAKASSEYHGKFGRKN